MTINLRSVDLNLLTVFDAVMEKGKLSEAAEMLGMTQPAVSNAVARLRLTFKDELFIRSRYGMVPTAKAKELLQPIRQALSIIQDTLDPSNEFDPNLSARTYKLAIGDYGELVLLPILLGIFSQYKGKLKIETYPEMDKTSFEQVRQGQLDFYFDYKTPQDEQLDYCHVADEEVVVIARKQHPKIGNTLSQQQYLKAQHVIIKYQHHQLTMLEDFLRSSKPIARDVVAEVCQYIALPGLVSNTDYLATVPRRMAEYYGQIYPIKILPLPFKTPKTKAYMIWHKSMNQDKSHQWLKDQILTLALNSKAQNSTD